MFDLLGDGGGNLPESELVLSLHSLLLHLLLLVVASHAATQLSG